MKTTIKYDLTKEYKVDINQPEIQEKIARAKAMFRSFVDEFRSINLRDDSSVERAYETAKQRGLLDYAAQIKELVFGRDITTYGVSYISDSCKSDCAYCPMKKSSVDTKTGKPIKRRTLTLEEFILDTKEIIKDGHSHICFLTGDGDLTTNDPKQFEKYLKAADEMDGIDEIIINVTPQTTPSFKSWKNAVKNKSLQFRVFQETYNREVYKEKHPCGPKQFYDFRRESQSRAMDVGFDNYGLGVLLGLNPHFLEEIEAISNHANEIYSQYRKMPARVCIPTANGLEGVNNVETQIKVSSKANELAYALAKLAMPEVSIVSSERDTPEMLRILDRYVTNRTVDVQPSVGGNIEQARNQGRLLKQTTVHSTSPKATAEDYAQRGYNLIFKY